MANLLFVLARATGLDFTTVRRIVSNAPRRYKSYTIPKRSGGRRLVSQPARELKLLQRAIVKHYLQDRPVHPAATAYVKGSSIRLNASRHAENGPILKIDIREFFPSITSTDFVRYCEMHNIFENREERLTAARILFRQAPGTRVLRLAIGAPSSPHVSNILLYEFDRLVSEEVAKDFVTYTRYADDMTFSASRTGYLNKVEKTVRRALRKIELPTLYINDEKTVLATKKYRREVTGLILTNDNRVSLGRDAKRLLRSQIDYFRKGLLEPKEARRLAGRMAFAMDVEPEFFVRMQRVYSVEVIGSLMRVVAETVDEAD